MMTGYPSWERRVWRSGPWGRNALMRPSDRIEALIRILAAVVVLAAVPLCAALGTAGYTDASAQIRAENATKISVTATLIADPVKTSTASLEMSSDRYEAPVGWTLGSRPGEATTTVAGTAHRGDPVTVWVGPDGHSTTPPLPGEAAAMRGIGFGLITFAEICGGTAGLVWATAAALGAWHRARWAREWRMISRPIGTQ